MRPVCALGIQPTDNLAINTIGWNVPVASSHVGWLSSVGWQTLTLRNSVITDRHEAHLNTENQVIYQTLALQCLKVSLVLFLYRLVNYIAQT